MRGSALDASGKPYAAGGRYGLYFRESLGTSHPQEPAGEMGPAGEGEASNPRGPRWWVLVLLALVIGIIVGVVLARAGERARGDLFDAQGRRTGYSVVDQSTGRVEGGYNRPEPKTAARGESTPPKGDQT